jgi:hypothetical protein
MHLADRGTGRAAVVPEVAPVTAWLAGGLGWLLPGAGHFLLGRWIRGLVLGGSVWLMFIAGLWLGGHLFPIWGPRDEGTALLLQVPPIIANIGSGALYIFCYLTNTGFLDQAKLPTYEYGNTFLLVAGLLNYLVTLDAFDIAAGRKP